MQHTFVWAGLNRELLSTQYFERNSTSRVTLRAVIAVFPYRFQLDVTTVVFKCQAFAVSFDVTKALFVCLSESMLTHCSKFKLSVESY